MIFNLDENLIHGRMLCKYTIKLCPSTSLLAQKCVKKRDCNKHDHNHNHKQSKFLSQKTTQKVFLSTFPFRS